jgi:hypothetical protein
MSNNLFSLVNYSAQAESDARHRFSRGCGICESGVGGCYVITPRPLPPHSIIAALVSPSPPRQHWFPPNSPPHSIIAALVSLPSPQNFRPTKDRRGLTATPRSALVPCVNLVNTTARRPLPTHRHAHRPSRHRPPPVSPLATCVAAALPFSALREKHFA